LFELQYIIVDIILMFYSSIKMNKINYDKLQYTLHKHMVYINNYDVISLLHTFTHVHIYARMQSEL